MPGMVRIPGRGKKIAYKIMGVPPNIAYRRDALQKKINRRLLFEETQRSR